jgi:hypothetical protein
MKTKSFVKFVQKYPVEKVIRYSGLNVLAKNRSNLGKTYAGSIFHQKFSSDVLSELFYLKFSDKCCKTFFFIAYITS